MDNSLAASRRLATRVVLAQAAAAALVGLGFLLQGPASALAAFAGGLVVAVGTAVLALRVFAPALAGPGAMMMRFAFGSLLKWAVVLVGLYLVFAYWKLPAVPALAGVAAVVVVNLVALKFER